MNGTVSRSFLQDFLLQILLLVAQKLHSSSLKFPCLHSYGNVTQMLNPESKMNLIATTVLNESEAYD